MKFLASLLLLVVTLAAVLVNADPVPHGHHHGGFGGFRGGFGGYGGYGGYGGGFGREGGFGFGRPGITIGFGFGR